MASQFFPGSAPSQKFPASSVGPNPGMSSSPEEDTSYTQEGSQVADDESPEENPAQSPQRPERQDRLYRKITFYKPRKDFAPERPGHAMQFEYSNLDGKVYISTAPQIAPMNSGVVFDWKNKKTTFKMSQFDLAALIGFVEYTIPHLKLVHKFTPKNGTELTSYFTGVAGGTAASCGEDGAWLTKQVAEGKQSPYCGQLILSKSGSGKLISKSTILAQPHEMIIIREFSKMALFLKLVDGHGE